MRIGPPALAWLQLRKEKLRLLVAIAGVAFADVLMLMQLGFRTVVTDAATQFHRRLTADLVVLHTDSLGLQFQRSFPRTLLYQTLANPQVQSVAPMYMALGSWRSSLGKTPNPVYVIGFPPDVHVLNMPEIEASQALLKVPEKILFDTRSRREFGPVEEIVKSGGTVTAEVSGQRVTVAGLYQWGASLLADGNILTSDETFLRIFRRSGDQIELGLVWTAPGANVEAVRDSLAAIMPPPVHVLTRNQFYKGEINFWEERTAIGFIFNFGVIMGFVVGSIIVYQILFADVSDHMSEYATLKAMGYSNTYISFVVGSEALILACLGYIPGLSLSFWLFKVCRDATEVPMQLTPPLAVGVFVLTVAMCALSGAIAVRKVKQADPADVF